MCRQPAQSVLVTAHELATHRELASNHPHPTGAEGGLKERCRNASFWPHADMPPTHGSRRVRGQPRVGELAEHQVGEFPEHFSLGLGEFIERRQIGTLAPIEAASELLL